MNVMSFKPTICLFILFFLVLFKGQSQDVHFTQALAAPNNLNPALTGNMNGTYRISTIYRDQWRGGIDQPLSTIAAGGDVKFDLNYNKVKLNDFVGIGVIFLSDRVDLLGMNTNKLVIQSAYHKRLSKQANDFLSFGIELGVQQRNINYDNLNFGDEFNQIDAYNQQTLESLPPNNFGFFDIGAGLSYTRQLARQSQLNVGVALHHFNTPKLSFFDNAQSNNPDIITDFDYKSKLTAHMSLDVALAEFFDWLPRVIFIQQGEQFLVDIGSHFKWDYHKTQSALYLGAWLKTVHGIDGITPLYISPMIGLQKQAFILGFSYDINLNQTFSGNVGLNAFEISIRFLGEHENEGNFCPEF